MIAPGYAGFLEAACRNPDEDTHRLALADWLDDHPDAHHHASKWAEFIRVQIQLAADDADDAANNRLGTNPLRSREAELFRTTSLLPGPWISHNGTMQPKFEFRRGLLDTVTCTAPDWLRHADQYAWHPDQVVLAPNRGSYARSFPGHAHPVRKVVLTTLPCLFESVDRPNLRVVFSLDFPKRVSTGVHVRTPEFTGNVRAAVAAVHRRLTEDAFKNEWPWIELDFALELLV